MKAYKVKTLLAGVSLFAAALSANAAALVTDWTATITSQWSSRTPGSVSLSPDNLTLSWGTSTGQGQSQLVIGNPVANQNVQTYVGGGAVPNSFWGLGSSVTHKNRPITGSSLTGASLTSTITLAAANPASAGPGGLPSLTVPISFTETPNATPCAQATNNVLCDDIFVLTGGLLNQSFNYDGYTYFVNVFPTSAGAFHPLSNGVCEVAGQGSGCIGFTTQEGQDTFVPFSFTISTEPLNVPEPGVLALAGLALAAMSMARRRKA